MEEALTSGGSDLERIRKGVDSTARSASSLSLICCDSAFISLNTLKEHLDQALDLYADVILNPSFPDSDFQRLQKQRLAGIQREKAEPNSMALRVMPGLVYGKGHAYGNPFTGSGTEASVQQLTTAAMRTFHDTWFKPNNATLIIVGDATLADLRTYLDHYLRVGEIPDDPSAANGLQVENRGAVTRIAAAVDASTGDVMGYCYPMWSSRYTYEGVRASLAKAQCVAGQPSTIDAVPSRIGLFRFPFGLVQQPLQFGRVDPLVLQRELVVDFPQGRNAGQVIVPRGLSTGPSVTRTGSSGE